MTAPDPVDVPPAPRSAVLCSAWASPADVPEQYRPLLSDEQWAIVLMQCSEILFYLSGRRFYGGGCTEIVILRSHPNSPGTGMWPYHDSWGDCPCWSSARWVSGELYPPPLGLFVGQHYAAMAIGLPRSPVTAVTAVLHNGVAFTAWRLTRSGWLERTDGGSWDLCQDSTEVSYSFGEAPPESGVQAAVALAVQVALAIGGSVDCQLPQRIQSITRQGISMAVLDPQEFLADGRTGIYMVDLFLAAVNPHGRGQRGRVWSPDLPRTIRK